MLPLIMSCPRGSNINPFLIQSYSFKKCCRFSLMLFPSSSGPPSATRRTGLPHACASTPRKTKPPTPPEAEELGKDFVIGLFFICRIELLNVQECPSLRSG